MLECMSPPGSPGVRHEGPFTRVLAGMIQTSGRGWEQLTCVARQGFHVSCELGPPCKVKSDRFAVTRGYGEPSSLCHIVVRKWNENGMEKVGL